MSSNCLVILVLNCHCPDHISKFDDALSFRRSLAHQDLSMNLVQKTTFIKKKKLSVHVRVMFA